VLFNSIDFAFFLPIVFILYWFVANRNLKVQNLLIVIASSIFYAWWDWHFLILILISSVLDFTIANLLRDENILAKRKLLLYLSVVVNLGFLGYFKYSNFFIESFKNAFKFFGHDINLSTLNIILPVGISFYTFQTLSYTIDVYRKQLEPTKDIVAFFAFVSFFPQLVAGPIERATNLLPQFYKSRVFNYNLSINGLRQILWGLFKKIVIADNCAKYANIIFNNSEDYSGSTLLLGAIFFTFQIYCDFSGYSDIAIGVSRLFGFDLKQNFAFPYFSRDIAEFWRRWHISLSTWFRDYLYIPLGGSKGSTLKKLRNTFIIFIVSGFWHGANWTFIVWGLLNAIYFIPLLLSNKNRINTNLVAEGRVFANPKEMLQILITFFMTVLAWVFFRADNVTHAISIIYNIFSSDFFNLPKVYSADILYLTLFFLVVEWIGRSYKYAIEGISKLPIIIRWLFYFGIVILLFVFTGEQQEFIYFQF
tara:strand:- start:31759 stop:33192 length:1434 start_codon:yes stop_codon:yes gene_type:complete